MGPRSIKIFNCVCTKMYRRNMSQCWSRVPRRGWFLALVLFSVLVTAGLMFIDHTSSRWVREEGMEETIAVMRTRLKFLESQYSGRQQDVVAVQARVDGGCDSAAPAGGNSVPNSTFSPELAALLRNISGSKASDGLLSPDKPELIKAPFSLRIMPHLMESADSLRPAFQLRSSRHYADYIIGVPHVRRDKETYLFDTLKYLLDKMSEEDKNYTMIVVMIGETDLAYVVQIAHSIEKEFPRAIDVGLIEVISPSKFYYPDLDTLPQNLGDSLKRVKWRSKQNLDAIFLMAFAHSRCLYYLMVEDDVLALDNYMTEIRKFTTATTVTNPGWFFIQYSTTGGIGKLFRSTDLVHFMTYVQLFYNNMPIDWLTESYLADRSCGINKGAKECAEAKTRIRPTFKTNLFKHIGLYSSLKGKLQKVKGVPESKSKTAEFFPHDNPPLARVKCDLGQHERYSLDDAYKGKNFFWGKQPKQGDVIEFWFQTPAKIDKYLIRSGNLKHVNDIISKAVLEVLPSSHSANGTFLHVDTFDEFGMVEGQVDSDKYGELLAIRIRFLENGKYWVAITEIEFVYLEAPAARADS